MGFFNLLQKTKPSKEASMGYFDVDFHSHLIYGVDDGSKSLEESLEIITFFQSLGVKKMITTPHISMDYFKNEHEDIRQRFQKLKTEVAATGCTMELGFAAEYMIDDGFRAIMNRGDLLTFGDNYLLIELSGFSEYRDFSALLFDLQTGGYNVILAHPERYSYWHTHKNMYATLKEREVIFQLNALSLTNVYSREVNKMAAWLIENKMIDFIGSDVHHAGQQHLYQNAFSSKLYEKLKATATIRNNELL